MRASEGPSGSQPVAFETSVRRGETQADSAFLDVCSMTHPLYPELVMSDVTELKYAIADSTIADKSR